MLIETIKKRDLLLVLTLFSLLCLLVPRELYAAEQGYGSFWYGPKETTVEGVKYLKTGVVASNKYDAALYALGFSKSTVTGISNAKKNSLKSNSTFNSFANGFKTGIPDNDAFAVIPGIPTIGLYPDSMLTTWYGAQGVYGKDSCYWSVYSEDAAESAKNAAFQIIKGGSSSGGGSGSGGTNAPVQDTSGWYKVTLRAENEPYSSGGAEKQIKVYDNPTVTLDSSTGKGSVSGGTEGEKITWKDTETVTAYVDPYTYNLVNDTTYTFANYCKTFDNEYIIASNTDDYEWVASGTDSNYKIKNTSNTTLKLQGYKSYNKLFYRVNGELCVFFDSATKGSKYSASAGNTISEDWKAFWYSLYEVDSPPPVDPDPPIDWPDPDPTPTPPTPPDPITPEPPNPWVPIPDEDIDITGEDFQDLIDALNEHCIHLQNSISSNISQLWSLQSDLFSDHMNTFWDNLHNDLLWLGECLNFDVNVNVDGGSGGDGGSEGDGEGDTNTYVPFDDTSIIYWLKQIWSKLGNGISIKPVDPVVNPDGWWDWFANLLGGLIGALADIGLDKIGGLVDALDTLKDKFPFCIPWDIAALLGLLVSEPVTPVIELPLMALSVSNGVQEVGSMTIDLSTYNDAWEAVRWIERIAFCVYLATRTKDFLDLLGKIKG